MSTPSKQRMRLRGGSSAKRLSSQGTESVQSSARKKYKRGVFTSDVPVKIQINHGESIYAIYIHQSRLEKVSRWFKRTAAHTEVIELDHVTCETLQTFYKWVYGDGDDLDVEGLAEEMEKANQGNGDDDDDSSDESEVEYLKTAKNKRMVAELSIDLEAFKKEPGTQEDRISDLDSVLDGGELPWYLTSSLDTRGQIFGRLLDLYMFCITYEIPALKIAVMLAWQRFSHTTSTYPCPTVTCNMVQRMHLSEGLVQYVIGCYAYYMDIKYMKKNQWRLNNIPSNFLTAVLISSRIRAKDDCDDEEPDNDWCQYHGHDTEKFKKACQDQDGREEDPDMRHKAAMRKTQPRRWGGCC